MAIYSTLKGCKPKTKVQTDVLDELLYADDMDKNVSLETKMQRAIDLVSQSYGNYDLTTKKTAVNTVHQPAPGKPYIEPTISVNGQRQVVDKFTYLGRTLSRAVHTCIILMMRSLPELQKPVWLSEDSVQMYVSEMESSLTPS